jgi:hypothetical protein
MAIFKSFNDLVISAIEYLRLVQPELDTKPGTVSRDVFVDTPSQQIANLYSQLRTISNLSSIFSISGTDLNKLASNYSVSRISGGSASGTVVFTTNNMDVDILISSGSIVTARNGVNFATQENVIMTATNANVYRATATRLRADLELAGITDEFAVEITVQSLTAGTSGNIGRFSITSHNIDSISNVTNLNSFSGGSNSESDDEFRSRILSIFAGSNTGTSLGYTNAVGIVPGILDSEIVVPGDPLLIRDGTQVSTNSDGNLVVSDPGSGGKVDIYILGSNLESQIDSFIFNDQSGKNDPTDPSNDYILGQKGQDTTLNAAQRRVTLISSNDLPYQPIDNIISVSGSSSGANFVEKYTDEQGREHGNYELVTDTGNFSGSPFGFDKLHWVSDYIELDNENVTKGVFNGIDSLNFSDVGEIRDITQDYLVTNENSITSTSNRSYVTLRHTPIRNVSRIVNLTTGERYIVEYQNPDGEEGGLNTTGKIMISGSTLPVGTDILQVDYTWVKNFDNVFDFDSLGNYNESRRVQDSVDWGFGNLVKNEPSTVVDDGYGNLAITVTHPIFKVLSVNSFDTSITNISNGTVTTNDTVTNVVDIRRISDNAELFNTDARGGTLSGTSAIVLPTDSIAEDGDTVKVRFNASDMFAPDGYNEGTFTGTTIILPENVTSFGTSVLVNYIANVLTLVPEDELSNLPFTKNNNKFLVAGEVSGEQPTSNLIDDDNNFTSNLRRAGSNIKVAVSSIPSEGIITISGTTVHKVTDALVVVTSGSGYEIDLQSAIKTDLNTTSISSNIQIMKLVSLERVLLDNSGQVDYIDNNYDIVNYYLKNNSYDLDVSLENSSISKTKVVLPQTSENVEARLNTGDIVRATFYYIYTNNYEQLYFSKDGTHITDKYFIDISRVSLASGFKDSSGSISGNITVSNFNQPVNNTVYNVSYDYTAPKENERITVTFNHNTLANDATNAIENVRPITADVLVKIAEPVIINVYSKIVLLSEYQTQSLTVVQDAIEAVTSFLTASSLGTTVDASDVINKLYSVNGIDRVRIINFSVGNSGNLLSVTAEKNQYLDAGTVTIEVEER